MSTPKTGEGRQRILEVAEKLFAEGSYRGVSIREIARACNLTNAALYYHFPNKEALFAEVMHQHALRLTEQMRAAAVGEQTPRARLRAMLLMYNHFAAKGGSAFFSLRHRGGIRAHHRVRDQFMEALLKPLDEVLLQSVETGELRPLPEGQSPAALLIGMLHGLAMYKKVTRQKNLGAEDVDAVLDIFWRGLKK